MKRIILLSTAIIFAATLWNTQAQTTEIQQEDPRAKRTPEEKEYYRLFETPENELSLDDQLLRFKILYLTGKNFYIENGELKTKCTKKDFARIGAKPSMYKVFLNETKQMNDAMKQLLTTEEALTTHFEGFLKSCGDSQKKLSEKIAELEKKKAAE